MEVLVLSLKGYDFKNDAGERVVGNKLYYIVQDEIEGVDGFAPMVVNIDSTEGINTVPGIYNLDFTTKTGKNNKPELVVKSMKFKANVNLFAKVS
jgi:hypothetical protein